MGPYTFAVTAIPPERPDHIMLQVFLAGRPVPERERELSPETATDLRDQLTRALEALNA